MTAFGQAESLTARLKSILDLYPEGTSVFSELVQNADDAGEEEKSRSSCSDSSNGSSRSSSNDNSSNIINR